MRTGLLTLGLISLACTFAVTAGASERSASEPGIAVVLVGQSLIQKDIREAGPALDETKALLQGDAVFTNFETTVHEPGGSLSALDPVSGVYAPPESFDALKTLGFNLVSLANNHIYDLHEPGLVASLRHVRRTGLANSGAGENLTRATEPGYLQTRNGVVALVSMATGFLHGRGRATADRPGLNELALHGGDLSGDGRIADADAARNLDAIREARKHADIVVVSHHNHVYDRPFVDLMIERSPDRLRPPSWVREWARREIDAGADVVAMHGAPFLQGVEIYKGKPILYDLGNYIFQVAPQHIELFGPLAGESAIVRARFAGKRLAELEFHPIVLDPRPTGASVAAEAARGLPRPGKGEQAAAILERLAQLSREFGTELRVEGSVARIVLADVGAAR